MTSKTRAKRHHFLPRLLLNGFASRTEGDQVYAWYFRKGAHPVETNIINIAAARYFHGRGGIEDKLAREEGVYADLVAELRRGSVPPGQEPLVAEVVSHLIVRTKHLRDGLDLFMKVITPVFLDGLLDPANIAVVRGWARQAAEVDPRFSDLPLPQRRLVMEELDRFVEESLARFRVERATKGDPVMSPNDSQLKALAGPVTAIQRTHALRQLNWSVVQTDAAALILGDIGPVARGEGRPGLESPLQFNSAIPTAVYLPISGEHLVIGQRAPGPIDPIDVINVASAELSRDFLISRRNTKASWDTCRSWASAPTSWIPMRSHGWRLKRSATSSRRRIDRGTRGDSHNVVTA